MRVNPLMTVWLISCFISYSGLTGANRNSNLKSEKTKHEASELSRLYSKEDGLASFKLDFLKLLTVEKKKKNKSCDPKPTTEGLSSCIASSSSTAKNKKGSKTTKQKAEYNDDSCSGSSSSTTKIKKGTKKIKGQSTKNSQGSDGEESKNSNGNDINTGGSNKWKKIQKFFFFPPNWSLTRSYKVSEPTTAEAKYKELRPIQFTQYPYGGMYEHTKITDATYLYPIPVITDQYKDNLLVKDEIIKKNATDEENINSKIQMSESDTSHNPFMKQPNETEKIPSRKFYEGDMMGKEPVSQESGYNTITSMGLIDKIDERAPSLQLDQQAVLLSTPWYMKPGKFTSRKELLESDTMLFTEEGTLPPQTLQNEPTITRITRYTNRVIYNYDNLPSNNQIESPDNITYSNKDTLKTGIFQTTNTINEAINERQFQLKPEEITDNTKDSYEVSMVRGVPELSLKPEAMIELEQPPNQTSMENTELSDKQNQEKIADKWKHVFSSIEPEYEQLKNVYSNIINHEKDLYTSSVENTFDKIVKPNFNYINNINSESNMTDYSNLFLEAFSNFLKKDIPELFTRHNLNKLHRTTQQPADDLDKYSDPTLNQYFFMNTETKLPTEEIKNNSSNVEVNEEKFPTFNFDTTMLFEKPTIDYIQKMETKMLSKDGSLHQKHGQNISTTPSSTIMQQYTIEMWPKYTEKTEYNIDYVSNVSTQSSVHSSRPSEESAYSNYQYQFNQTRAGISSTESTDRIQKTFESTESPKAVAFEALVTIPLIFNDKNLEIQSDLTSTQVTTTKHLGHQSILNLTLHPMIFDNLWGIQSYLNNSSNKPVSTKLDVFMDDKIPFDNQHEFNANHHFQSTTSQPFYSTPTIFEWAPFNVPVFGNEFDIISTSTSKISEITQEYTNQVNDFVDINEPSIEILKKNKMAMVEKSNIRNFTLQPKYMPFSSDINTRNLFLLNHPLEKPEAVKKIHKYVNHKNELINDPIWNEIIYQTRLGKEKNGFPSKAFTQTSDLPDGNKIYTKFRKPILLEEKLRVDNLKSILPFVKGRVDNNERGDIEELLDEEVLRKIKKIESMAPTMDGQKFDKIEVIKNEIDEIVTKSMNKVPKTRNNFNFWSNLNGSTSYTKELKESTDKYEQTNPEVNDEFIENLNNWPLLELQRKNFSKGRGNKFDLQSIINNEMLTKQAYISSLNDIKPVTSTNSWWVRNEQNEKLLASEKSFDRQLPMSSPLPVSFQKQINFDQLKNNIGLLKNMMNQSFPEITNNSDVNKNEFSAIQMSAIKIFNKKPEMFAPPLHNSFKSMFDLNDNNTEINREMSRMFLKMQDFANKFGMKKILLKRAITDPQNNHFESNSQWRNKCSVVPFKTETIPFNINFTPKIETSHSIVNIAKKINITNNQPNTISDKWKYNMQSMIDKWNEKRNLHSNIYDNNAQKYSERLLSNVVNTKLKHVANQHEALEKYLGNEMQLSFINSDDSYGQIFTDNSKEKLKRNAVGNKKMKSRELEFILDRNLPRLPLNKRQFIAYMMTGLKSPGTSITFEDEKHSQLSKANIQNLIDRNIKKDKVVELISKRSRKKQWQTNTFP